jgi:hypothetical protein
VALREAFQLLLQPDPWIAGAGPWYARGTADARVPGLHFYTLNESNESASMVRMLNNLGLV